MATFTKITKNDWIRFQVADMRVLEGYVQDVSPDGTRVRIGKAPDSPENEWHQLEAITILKTQELMATT